MLSLSKRLSFLTVFALCFLLVACDSPEEKEAKYIERGNVLFEQGDYTKAELEYKNAQRINPTSPEVAYRIGLIAEAKSKFRDAFMSFKKAAQQDQNYVPARVKMAEYYLAGKQTAMAKNEIDKALSLAPNNSMAHALLASYYVQNKSYEEAQKEIDFALSKDPTNKTAFVVQANLYLSQDKVNEALGALDEGIARLPDNLSFYLLKAVVFEKEKDLVRLEQTYKDIFRIRPRVEHFHRDLARIFEREGQKEKAESVMRGAIERFPESLYLKHDLIKMLDKMNGYQAAEQEIQNLRASAPDNDDYIFWLAELYIQHKDTAKAIDLLNEMTKKEDVASKAGTQARSFLANLYLSKGNKQTAEKLAHAVLEERPDNTDALLVRAHLSFENGKYEEAANDLRSIVRVSPKNISSRLILAEILLLQHHLDLAIDTLGQILVLNPGHERAQIRLAQLLELKGEKKKALEIITKLNERLPSSPVGWETRARFEVSSKNFEEAQKAIEKLESFEGYKTTALFLRGKVAEAQGDTAKAHALYSNIVRSNESDKPIADIAIKALIKMSKGKEDAEKLVLFLEQTEKLSPKGEMLLAEGYIKIGKQDIAAQKLDQLIENNAVDAQIYLDRARIYLKDRKIEEALSTLSKAIQIAPMDLRPQMMRADILGKEKRYEEAIADYQAILDKSPNADIAANNMAQLIADYQGDDAEKLEKARLAAERFISSSNPLFLDTLAWVYYKQGDLAQAQTIMARVMNYTKDMPPSIHYHNGAILIALGKLPEGRAEIQKALNMDKVFPERKEAEKLLKDSQAK